MADMPAVTLPESYDPQFEGASGAIAPGQEDLAREFWVSPTLPLSKLKS